MKNNRSKGNNFYNRRIADLAIQDGFNANRIWTHIISDEAIVFAQFPISVATVRRRVRFYEANRAAFERFYNNKMQPKERDLFMKRMKLDRR